MCGIAGFVQKSPPGSAIGGMLAALAHRGPDGEGTWAGRSDDWHVVLGHRRLAIIDVERGRQPMGDPREQVQLTYNGEIYNFRELRRGLEADYPFATRSDTEVLLHHYRARGVAGLPELNGMFAFGLWDASERALLLARDRIGVKPLYYASLPDGGLAFASELSALLTHPALSRDPSADGLLSLFFSDYVHPPHTVVAGVHKLPPGCSILWRDGVLSEPLPYWRLTDSPRALPRNASAGEMADLVRAKLADAVERQLVADVPVGVLLSGGVDSSTMAALAAPLVSGRLRTFSIGFEDPRFDESGHARAVARHVGSEHVERILSEASVLGVLDEALGRLDEPLADPSLLPTFLLSALAAAHVKVVLGGDGGDELFAGYPTYRAHRYARSIERLPLAIRERLVCPLVRRLPPSDAYQGLSWKLERFFLRWDEDPVRRHLRWMSNTDLDDLRALMPSIGARVPATLGGSYPRRDDLVSQMSAVDLLTYLPGSVLTKVDRASMAHGLEVRPPFLDNEVVDLALSIPAHLKLRGAQGKVVLKRAVAPLLPKQVLERPKRGFAIPLSRWLRGPLRPAVEDAVASKRVAGLGLLSQATLRRWNAEHQARRADRCKPLWALVVLDRWLARA